MRERASAIQSDQSSSSDMAGSIWRGMLAVARIPFLIFC
jgi:hypothetical protein